MDDAFASQLAVTTRGGCLPTAQATWSPVTGRDGPSANTADTAASLRQASRGARVRRPNSCSGAVFCRREGNGKPPL